MRTLLVLAFLASLCLSQHVELTKDGLNILSKTSLDYVLENNKTVLAVWNSENCMDCAEEMWNVYKAIYSFLDEPNFFVFATTVGADKELDAKYGIDPNDGGSFFRLFIDGSDKPVRKEDTEEDSSLDIETWIAHVTHYVPQPDYVTLLTTSNYNSFFENNKYRSVLVMYYMPSYQSSQLTVVQFYRAALAFRIEAKVVFARMDCKQDATLCREKNIMKMPTFTFYPATDVSFDGHQLETTRGEGIVRYLNEVLDTHVSPKGGFDEQFGRHPELDRLAHLFMANKNPEQRRRIMKETAKLRHRFRSTAKYYKIMKDSMKEGAAAVMRELRAVKDGMKGLDVTSDEYANLRIRENIIHQFEAITTKRELVRLNPWNFDYVVNGMDDVVVFFHAPWCDMCSDLLKEMEEVVKYRTDDVVFASMDAQLYVDFCAPFHVSHFPSIKFFKAGGDVTKPVEIPGSTRGDVEKFLRQQAGEETEL